MRKFYFQIFHLFLVIAVLVTGIIYLLKDSQNIKSSGLSSMMLSRVTAPEGPDRIPNDWMDRQRSYPYGVIKTEAYLEAMKTAKELHSATRDKTPANWQFVGPLNIGGRITDIETPGNNAETIYIGAASGGIFKTENNGETWENIFHDAAILAIGDIAIDPNDSNVIWAGTGEANASSQSYRGDGIYKSMDGGQTWQHKGLEQSAYFGRIIVDHQDSDRVFAAVCGNLFSPDGNRGIYRTEDGGASWQRVLYVNDSVSGIDIIQHPTNPYILYAAMWERMRGLNYRRSFGNGSGVWKTIDGGDTWTELANGLPQGSEIGRIGLALCESSPEVLYAFYDNLSEVAVYKSQNNGESWLRTVDYSLQGMNSNFGWYFGQIRVNPENPLEVYVLGVDLYYSSDAGNSWTQLAGYFNFDEIHVDHHALHFDAQTGRILEGNDGGLYYTYDAGYSWDKINNLPLTQFYDIETDYLNPHRIYGGTQDNNTIRTSTGNLDDWHPILGGDGFYTLVDYTNSDIIYAEYQYGGLSKSTNGGYDMYPISYAWSSERVNWSAPLIMHPQDPQTLYFGTFRVWKSTTAGELWTPVSGDLTEGDDGSSFHTITTLGISPLDTEIILAGTDDGHVHISTTGGNIWNDISAGLPDRWITRVAADPFDVNTIYVTCSGFRWDEPLPHIFKSVNLGQTWIEISSNLPEIPVNSFVADPTRQNRLFAGTDAGIFWSNNAGAEWQTLNGNLSNVPITSMKLHRDENFLLIGTYGLGAYKLDLSELTIGTDDYATLTGNLTIASAYPNPFKSTDGEIHFGINSSFAQEIAIRITDLSGKIAFEVKSYKLNQGINVFSWSGKNLKGISVMPGIYLMEVNSGKQRSSIKFLVL